MRNFVRIAESQDVLPIALALARRPDLWNAEAARTTFPDSPHSEADDILLRFEDIGGADVASETLNDVLDAAPRVWRQAWSVFPEVRPLVLGIMQRVGAYELTRVMMTRLAPGKTIAPHSDVKGAYANLPDIARYHVVIQGLPGSLFHCGAETVCMRTGDVWWFNAALPHSVENNSADDRIHLLVDARLMP